MNAEHPSTATAGAVPPPAETRPDVNNANVREDVAESGRCALVHLPTGRTCFLPLRHPGPCEFHRPRDVGDVLAGG